MGLRGPVAALGRNGADSLLPIGLRHDFSAEDDDYETEDEDCKGSEDGSEEDLRVAFQDPELMEAWEGLEEGNLGDYKEDFLDDRYHKAEHDILLDPSNDQHHQAAGGLPETSDGEDNLLALGGEDVEPGEEDHRDSGEESEEYEPNCSDNESVGSDGSQDAVTSSSTL